MEPRTSRKDYLNHQYSGPRKSRKRVLGQMKRYHGESKSRSEVWCKKIKTDNNPTVPICKRKATTPCHNHVKSILYKTNVLTNDMAYDQYNESVARTLFIEKMKKAVRPAGLFIDEEFGFLGASPDGIIEEEESILEIKCFPSLARNNQDMFSAAKDRKNFPLYIDSNGSLQINKKHNFYYQIQGQLRVTKMKKCYFVGFNSPTYDINILEIERDEVFIDNMIPKLVKFYKNCVLPEVVLRRVSNNQSCLDISLW